MASSSINVGEIGLTPEQAAKSSADSIFSWLYFLYEAGKCKEEKLQRQIVHKLFESRKRVLDELLELHSNLQLFASTLALFKVSEIVAIPIDLRTNSPALRKTSLTRLLAIVRVFHSCQRKLTTYQLEEPLNYFVGTSSSLFQWKFREQLADTSSPTMHKLAEALGGVFNFLIKLMDGTITLSEVQRVIEFLQPNRADMSHEFTILTRSPLFARIKTPRLDSVKDVECLVAAKEELRKWPELLPANEHGAARLREKLSSLQNDWANLKLNDMQTRMSLIDESIHPLRCSEDLRVFKLGRLIGEQPKLRMFLMERASGPNFPEILKTMQDTLDRSDQFESGLLAQFERVKDLLLKFVSAKSLYDLVKVVYDGRGACD